MRNRWFFLILALSPVTLLVRAETELIRPKVVVVAMFEAGQDTGDTPGEFQFWVERRHLDRVIPLPAASHAVRVNADGSIIGIVTGVGTARATATIMALGLDPRFDLRASYWVVAGIAGIDPADGSLGSAAWAEYIVDGDLAHEIDPREAPADWPTGYVPLRRKRPYEQPAILDGSGDAMAFHLDPGLVEWAFQLTKDISLPDTAQMKKRREAYVGFPQAQRPPFVMKGDNLASSTFWHGTKMNAWANAWVSYYTGGQGHYVTTAMEDSGTLHALTSLTRAGRVDVRRALVLRTASNYDMQSPGQSAAESLAGEHLGAYSGYLPSLESAFLVGSKVVDTLVADWAKYEKEPPSGKK